MSLEITFASALSAVRSFTSKIRRRGEAEIRQSFAEGVPDTAASRSSQTASPPQGSCVLEKSTLRLSPATRLPQSSPITRLPQELVDAIIYFSIYDICTLLACSLTCHSWYIATIRHLHYSLTTDVLVEKVRWPTPLQQSYNLGLLPLVKRFRIRSYGDKSTPDRFYGHNLHYFPALTNLQELGIDYLQVSSFMPNIQQCFGHLVPTLRFLALKQPEGPRALPLFPKEKPGSTTDADLTPLSVPPLQGRLTLTRFANVRLVKDMIVFFGGLRFRSMDLFGVKCTRLLLEACAETLETLRLYPTDTHVGDEPVGRRFDLSRNMSLRTRETAAHSIYQARAAASGFLKTVLSTTIPSLPIDVVITHHGAYVGLNVRSNERAAPVEYYPSWASQKSVILRCHSERFKVFREMHEVRKFRLVFCADGFSYGTEHAMREVKRILGEEKARGGLDYLQCEPLIILR